MACRFERPVGTLDSLTASAGMESGLPVRRGRRLPLSGKLAAQRSNSCIES